jgi:polyisoprenoid-binding protein YceI
MRIAMRRFTSTSHLAALALGALALAGPCKAASYVFDQKRTEVRFSYSLGFGTGAGRFTKVRGTAQFDPAEPATAKVEAVIETASLMADEPMVESELKGTNFFNVTAQPQMTFKSHEVDAEGADAARLSGDITVNGITRPVVLQVMLQPHTGPALKYSAGSLELVAKTQIRRRDFNMTAYADMVGDEVQIEIRAVLRPAG